MSNDQGRFLDGFDELGHGEGLARPGSPEKYLGPLARTDAVCQGGNGLGLVAHRLIGCDDVEGMGCIVIFIVMGHIHKRYLFFGPFFQFLYKDQGQRTVTRTVKAKPASDQLRVNKIK